MTIKHLFLDLEGTTVAPFIDTGVTNAHLLNPVFVKTQIQRIQPQAIFIFSYALYNQHDLKLYQEFLQTRLSRVFGQDVLAPYSLEDFCRASEAQANFAPNTLSLGSLRSLRGGKRGGFIDFVKQLHAKNSDQFKFYLIDDEVRDEVLSKDGLQIEFINGSSIED